MGYQAIMFDLGNVLISFSHEKMFSQVSTLTGLPKHDVEDLLIHHRVAHQYERGLISSEDIYKIIHKKSPNTFHLSDLLNAASSIFSPRLEMEALVQTLKKKGYTLILLSNTVEPHYQYISTNYSFLEAFDHIVLSYEVESAKPEVAIFDHALKKANLTPSSCFFVDDMQVNVEAAERLGIRAHQFRTLSHLMEDFIRAGIL